MSDKTKGEIRMQTIKEMYDLGFKVREWEGGYAITGYIGNDKEVVIPEGVIAIGPWAFPDNKLEKVTFPKSLKCIGYEAFDNNKITEVDFNNVDDIGNCALSHNPIKKFTYKGVTHIVKDTDRTLLEEVGMAYRRKVVKMI